MGGLKSFSLFFDVFAWPSHLHPQRTVSSLLGGFGSLDRSFCKKLSFLASRQSELDRIRRSKNLSGNTELHHPERRFKSIPLIKNSPRSRTGSIISLLPLIFLSKYRYIVLISHKPWKPLNMSPLTSKSTYYRLYQHYRNQSSLITLWTHPIPLFNHRTHLSHQPHTIAVAVPRWLLWHQGGRKSMRRGSGSRRLAEWRDLKAVAKSENDWPLDWHILTCEPRKKLFMNVWILLIGQWEFPKMGRKNPYD